MTEQRKKRDGLTAKLQKGNWTKMPNALIRGTAQLGLKPCHVWLLIALESLRFKNHPPRMHWGALAKWAGVSISTVRRWADDLKKLDLLDVEQRFVPREGEERKLGVRNDANVFHLAKAWDAVEKVQNEIDAKKKGGSS